MPESKDVHEEVIENAANIVYEVMFENIHEKLIVLIGDYVDDNDYDIDEDEQEDLCRKAHLKVLEFVREFK